MPDKPSFTELAMAPDSYGGDAVKAVDAAATNGLIPKNQVEAAKATAVGMVAAIKATHLGMGHGSSGGSGD